MLTNSASKARKRCWASVACVTATVFAVAIPQASSATEEPGRAIGASQGTGATAPGVPTFVHLPADLVAHQGNPNEWWYTVGHVSSHGHEYGYEVQLTSNGLTELAITDVSAGKYYTQQVGYDAGEFSVSSTQLDVQMPNATLTGTMNNMHLTAKLPAGSLDLHLNSGGSVMYGNGTGLFPFLGGSSYDFSLPNLQTSGTLTVDGKSSVVTGKSWMDRQWGTWDWAKLDKWTWISVQLDNGESINLTDLFDKSGEEHWATVLHPDGSESVVSVTPLAAGATDFQTSPTTGQRYAGKWIVEIPSLNTRLKVTATPTLQEVQAESPVTPGIDEAASTATGFYQHKPVTGKAYVEQFGIWK